jgi:hypoxanthine phosphoribosyltransferase
MFKEESVKNRLVIVVEDIIDSGNTMKHIHNKLLEYGVGDIITVTMLNKESARKVKVNVGVSLFTIDDGFVVGFGLDYDGLGRNLCGIYKEIKDGTNT